MIYYEAYRHQKDAFKREQSLKQFGGAYRQLKLRLNHEFKNKGLIKEGGGEPRPSLKTLLSTGKEGRGEVQVN